MVRALLSRLIYPVLTAGGVLAAWLLLSAGVSLAQAVVAVTVVAAGFVIALERLLPYSREWQHVRPDIPTDAGHLILGNAAAEGVRLALVGPLLALSAYLARSAGVSLWPAHLPMPVQLLLGLVLAELGGYWGHRLMHERPLLFRMHAVHHSAHRIYFLTGARNHVAEIVFLAVLGDDWRITAAGCTARLTTVRTTARSTEADMRALFWSCVTIVVVGLGYVLVLGMLHR